MPWLGPLLGLGCVGAGAGAATPTTRVLDAARAVAAEYGHGLVARGITWNGDEVGRELAAERHGDSSVGTCGHLASELRASLLAAGFATADVAIVSGEKLRPRFHGSDIDLTLALELNCDHAAVVVWVNREPFVFDAWLHGRENRDFGAFGSSRWCGIAGSTWFRAMTELGYNAFQVEDGPPVSMAKDLFDRPHCKTIGAQQETLD